jgi:ATP-dependent DNA ligase
MRFRQFAPKAVRVAGVTKEEMTDCASVRPKLVAQVSFVEWTVHGNLRHPKLVGVRDDAVGRTIYNLEFIPSSAL